MNYVKPSPELTTQIQGWIKELHPDTLGAWPIRVCKEELNALPIHSTLIYLWALQPDGTVLCMDHEALFHPTEPETDPLNIYASLANGSRKYPELRELLLSPPTGARPCTSCNGTGIQEQKLGEATNSISCYGCSGMGWIIERPSI